MAEETESRLPWLWFEFIRANSGREVDRCSKVLIARRFKYKRILCAFHEQLQLIMLSVKECNGRRSSIASRQKSLSWEGRMEHSWAAWNDVL